MPTYIANQSECFKNIAYDEIWELYAVSVREVSAMGWMSWMDHIPPTGTTTGAPFQNII